MAPISGKPKDLRSNLPSKPLTIKGSDRLCLFGRTGSGKTTLAKYLIEQVPRYVVLDPKGTFNVEGIPVVKSFSRMQDRQIVRPKWNADTYMVFDHAMLSAYKQRNIVVYLDETTMHTKPTVINPTLGMLIRLGRERGVGTWCASQRPKNIPSAIFTEAEHIFSFPLNFRLDREKVESFTADGVADEIATLQGHDFVYFRVHASELRHMPALKL